MSVATLIYPHQLYSRHPALIGSKATYLIEDPLYFTQYPFHKQKLVLHRASMKNFAENIKDKHKVTYVDSEKLKKSEDVSKILKKDKVTHVKVCQLVDSWLEKKLLKSFKKSDIELEFVTSPNFLSDSDFLKSYFDEKESYFFHSFYIEQRKRLDILVNKGKPQGGKWSFDVENRKKLPKDIEVPDTHSIQSDEHIEEAKRYVEKNFKNNPGSIENVYYPITTRSAKYRIKRFLENKLENYGPYQDSIDQDESFLFHSVLTPALNIGLISPDDIVKEAITFYDEKGVDNFASFEGFIRQVIGWREYVRAVYERVGGKQRTTNHFNMKRKIPSSFWDGTTGIVPVDNVIKRLLQTGYSNHIERLMVMSNFMLLCEFDPDEIYEWFMSLYIDAYDWVMVPNVYGMGLYADGGLMVTKPYISSSNYIRKMSHYKKDDWCDTWDGLYWYFIGKRHKLFKGNQRMSMILRQYEKMSKEKYNTHKKNAEKFLKNLR